MIFKSKMIRDPNTSYSNLLGLTVGLTFHTPKFWNCRKHNFDTGFLWVDPPIPEAIKESRYLQAKEHENCKWPYLHRSYTGYAYWTGPKRRYEFHYMGRTHPREMWWKPFTVRKNWRYTRWLDNGPQNPPRPPLSEDDRAFIDAIHKHHREQAVQIKKEMAEYRAQRESEQ